MFHFTTPPTAEIMAKIQAEASVAAEALRGCEFKTSHGVPDRVSGAVVTNYRLTPGGRVIATTYGWGELEAAPVVQDVTTMVRNAASVGMEPGHPGRPAAIELGNAIARKAGHRWAYLWDPRCYSAAVLSLLTPADAAA